MMGHQENLLTTEKMWLDEWMTGEQEAEKQKDVKNKHRGMSVYASDCIWVYVGGCEE